MLKLTAHFLCGVLLVTATGCQTARSVKDTIVNWRPSFHKSGQDEKVAESETKAEKAQDEIDAALKDLEVKTASLKQAAEELESVDLEEIVTETDASETSESEATVSEAADRDVEEQLSDFEKYQRSLLEQKEKAEQLVTEAEQVIEEKEADAQLLIQQEVEDGDTEAELADIDPAFMDTEKLSEEIDALLSDRAPEETPLSEELETAEETEEVADENSTPVQQALLAKKQDTGDIAFDLASFADSSIKDAETLSELEPETAADAVAAGDESTIEEIQSDYPWAAEGKEQLAEKTNDAANEQPVEQQQVAATSQPKKIQVSEEILQNLEKALGDENWRAAGRIRIQSDDAYVQTEEYRQISELIHNHRAKVRLQGLRLAVQNGDDHPEIVALVETLLDDEDQVVRAHAASALNQWKRSPQKAVATLASVLESQNENARQFAAMYLGDMKEQKQQVIPLLETHLLSAQGMTALHLSEALLKLDPTNVDAVSRLTMLLRDSNVEVRWLAAHALGAVQGELQPYAVEALRGGLRDVDSQVRATSALALGGLGNASRVAVAELNFMLEHGEPNVKDAARIALDCIQ